MIYMYLLLAYFNAPVFIMKLEVNVNTRMSNLVIFHEIDFNPSFSNSEKK